MLRELRDWIIPVLCAACREPCAETDWLCEVCAVGRLSAWRSACPRCGEVYEPPLLGTEDHTCGQCRRREPPWVQGRSIFIYGGPIRDAIVAWKHRPDPVIGRQLTEGFRLGLEHSGWLRVGDIDLVVPVGTSWSKALRRGGNPAAVLARAAAQTLNCPTLSGGLRIHGRCSKGKPHWRCGDGVKGARVLIVDDVYTTGETTRRAARACMRADAQSVHVLTLARTMR